MSSFRVSLELILWLTGGRTAASLQLETRRTHAAKVEGWIPS